MTKVKTSGKVLGLVIFLAIAFAAKVFWWDTRPINEDNVIKVGVVTWPGYLGGQYMNDGFEANKESRMYKDYGLLVEFSVIDDFLASRKAFENGEIDLLWVTADALPTELGAKSSFLTYRPKFAFQVDWSRGGDAIVAIEGINSIGDLKGRKVAVAQGTPSHTFLIDALQTNGMSTTDIEIVYVPSAIDAAEMFKNGGVHAAVVWSPDDAICINKVQGSKILLSTATATNIIADGFLVKEEFMTKNENDVLRLYEAWMVGNSELNNNTDGARAKGASILASKFQMTVADAASAMNNVRYVTHGDNINFFGLGDSKKVTGSDLYNKMANIYSTLGMVDRPVTWRDASSIAIVQKANLTGSAHEAEKPIQFIKASKELEEKVAFSNKKVTINFATGKYALSDNDKFTINMEFADILKQYQGARIRIEGNTDNTGSAKVNTDLSYKRANSVKEFLVSRYGVDPNRIIIIGNGPKHAIADGIQGANEDYRRTDFQLIQE